jgi:UDP-glucose 4-epimerase
VREDAPKRPLSPYGWQKGAVEDFLRLAASLYGMESICLRYFNVFGPRQPGNSAYSTAIAAWCDKMTAGSPLRFDGDGTQTRDMIFVKDVVNANILAATVTQRLAGETVNIGTGRETSNNQILDIFKKTFKNVNIEYAPKRVGDIDRIYAGVQRAKDVLGFESKTDLETGLNATFKWWMLIGD